MSLQDGGYTLEQLLRWCEEDRLIDGYERSDDEAIVIFLDGGSRKLSYDEATNLLKGIFTSTQRGSHVRDVRA